MRRKFSSKLSCTKVKQAKVSVISPNAAKVAKVAIVPAVQSGEVPTIAGIATFAGVGETPGALAP